MLVATIYCTYISIESFEEANNLLTATESKHSEALKAQILEPD